ncbi:hypothetical protein BKA81DRAFT_134880 [Phyllosticta paracitricarpa]
MLAAMTTFCKISSRERTGCVASCHPVLGAFADAIACPASRCVPRATTLACRLPPPRRLGYSSADPDLCLLPLPDLLLGRCPRRLATTATQTLDSMLVSCQLQAPMTPALPSTCVAVGCYASRNVSIWRAFGNTKPPSSSPRPPPPPPPPPTRWDCRWGTCTVWAWHP